MRCLRRVNIMWRALAGACTTLATTIVLMVSPAYADVGEIAYIANDQASIHLVRADGSGDRQLLATPGLTNLAWAPDGKTLAYLVGMVTRNFHGPQRVFLYDTGTGRSTEVKDAGFVGAVAFFPDGKRLLGQGGIVDRACEGPLGVLDLATGKGTPLQLSVGCVTQVQIAPGGTDLIASAQLGGRDLGNPIEVWDIDLATEQPTLLGEAAPGQPYGIVGAVSPDNQILASLALMGPDSTPAAVALVVADRDGSNPRTVWQSPMSGQPAAVTFAPDGAEVAVEILQPAQSGGGAIWVVGSDGSNPRQVASGWSPAWRPSQGSGAALPASTLPSAPDE
jgi:WD40-like Beta Propeller Repeat